MNQILRNDKHLIAATLNKTLLGRKGISSVRNHIAALSIPRWESISSEYLSPCRMYSYDCAAQHNKKPTECMGTWVGQSVWYESPAIWCKQVPRISYNPKAETHLTYGRVRSVHKRVCIIHILCIRFLSTPGNVRDSLGAGTLMCELRQPRVVKLNSTSATKSWESKDIVLVYYRNPRWIRWCTKRRSEGLNQSSALGATKSPTLASETITVRSLSHS